MWIQSGTPKTCGQLQSFESASEHKSAAELSDSAGGTENADPDAAVSDQSPFSLQHSECDQISCQYPQCTTDRNHLPVYVRPAAL